ncbi:Anaphase-promoting complex subunit 7 [Dissostichus eleginoides]|uniref:Anaphase-promoting complex subunit 7 n=1 Tax=Dissostichus eleginoides TaxID=100907 RepID=A0AAD9F8L9_DISEL|nr:Anaphase-promoting complex subunit 7 [Dissostichus eleginoides]
MEKEESPTDATVELDGDDMEGSGEDGDLEGSDSEAAQWADQEQCLDPNDQKSLEGMQKMEKEESPTDATVELDGDDMEGSGEDGDLEGSDSEAAQWADQEQWFGMQ